MSTKSSLGVAFTIASICPAAASAALPTPLSIVDVAAPPVNCVFNNAGPATCTVITSDSVGSFTPPGDLCSASVQFGNARLQPPTYPGVAPAPGAGTMTYLYRVDLTGVMGDSAKNCVTKLQLDFGSVVAQPYGPKGNADVW